MTKTRADLQAQIEKLQAEMEAMSEKKKEILIKALMTDDFVEKISELSDGDLKLLATHIQEKSESFIKEKVAEAKKAVKAAKTESMDIFKDL